MNTEQKSLKQKVLQELYLFWIYTAFLALVFCSLTTYQRLILAEYSISYLHYSYGIVEAMVLAKIILLGESFGLAEKFANKPLIIPTVYKAIIFSVFALCFFVSEHFVTGFIRGVSAAKIYQEIISHSLAPAMAKAFVVFIVLILFFAFLEIARMLGENKLLKFFFSHNPNTSSDPSTKR